LGISYWVLDIGHWALDIGYWTLVIGLWLLDIGYWTLDIGTLDIELWNCHYGMTIVALFPMVQIGIFIYKNQYVIINLITQLNIVPGYDPDCR
jgi:hypothetical protein